MELNDFLQILELLLRDYSRCKARELCGGDLVAFDESLKVF